MRRKIQRIGLGRRLTWRESGRHQYRRAKTWLEREDHVRHPAAPAEPEIANLIVPQVVARGDEVNRAPRVADLPDHPVPVRLRDLRPCRIAAGIPLERPVVDGIEDGTSTCH